MAVLSVDDSSCRPFPPKNESFQLNSWLESIRGLQLQALYR